MDKINRRVLRHGGNDDILEATFLGTSFYKDSYFNQEFKTASFCGRKSIICRSSVAAIYQNKPLSPVSFFNCRDGLCSDKSQQKLQTIRTKTQKYKGAVFEQLGCGWA